VGVEIGQTLDLDSAESQRGPRLHGDALPGVTIASAGWRSWSRWLAKIKWSRGRETNRSAGGHRITRQH
jgi:hypothetical protein